ncbi:LysR substrate-binding domain-containing protein [Streptomyces sp. NPDC007088]|uniref:LysR substrate-binding domain-containing protein n=1 Tax=Streptomyces sp. NPDC007088 TaxID=3364773 RepID=UPI0036CBDC68
MDLLRHLRYFRAVAEEEHFGRAAERLRLTQPSLSQRVRRLEEELGLRLLDRTSRGAVPTPAGRAVLAESAGLLEAADRLERTVADLRNGTAGTLRVSVPRQLGARALTALLLGHRERSAGAEVEIHESDTVRQVRALRAGGTEIALVRQPCPPEGLEFGPALRQPLGVLLSLDEAGPGPLPAAALTGRPLALLPTDGAPGLRARTLTDCARHGWTPSSVREAPGLDLARALVLSGDTVALLPEVPDAAGTVWRPLAAPAPAWEVRAAWPAAGATAAARLFADTAYRCLRESAGFLSEPPSRPLFPRPASEFPL